MAGRRRINFPSPDPISSELGIIGMHSCPEQFPRKLDVRVKKEKTKEFWCLLSLRLLLCSALGCNLNSSLINSSRLHTSSDKIIFLKYIVYFTKISNIFRWILQRNISLCMNRNLFDVGCWINVQQVPTFFQRISLHSPLPSPFPFPYFHIQSKATVLVP